MRRVLLRIMVLSVILTLTMAGAAWAHTTVSPEEASAGESMTFTVNTPGEKEIPIVEERVEIPEGFEVLSADSPEGWEGSVEGGSVVWTGGEIAEGEEQEFTFEASASEEPGEYQWNAFDTYEDGSVSKWNGPPDSDSPASVVRVVAGGAQSGGDGHSHGDEEASHHGSDEELPESGGVSPVALYGALGAGLLSLAGALVALSRMSRR